MPSLTTAVHWLDTHALSIAVALATATGILRAVYALASRILAPYPRARAFVEAVAAMAPDFLRFAQQVFRLLTGRDLPSTQPATPAPVSSPAPLSVVAEKAGAVAVFDTRPTTAPPAPVAPSPLRAVTLTGVALPPDATQAQYESARQYVAGASGFDAAARQEIAPEVVAAARAASERGDE